MNIIRMSKHLKTRVIVNCFEVSSRCLTSHQNCLTCLDLLHNKSTNG